MKFPRFSIIVPLYNKGHIVSRTIESALAQTFNDFEILVINDGSTDNSEAVVRSFVDPRIKLITKENGGEGSARNFGIKMAQAEYVSLLDADDIWHPDYLASMDDLIKLYPNMGIYCSAMIAIYGDGTKIIRTLREYKKEKYKKVEDYFDAAREGSFMYSSTITIPKKIFAEVGEFEPKVKMGTDTDMWARILLNYDMAYCTEPLVDYMNDIGGQATADQSLENFPMNKPIYITFNRLYTQGKFPPRKELSMMKYIDYVFKKDAALLLFMGGNKRFHEFAISCHAEILSPFYYKISKSRLLTWFLSKWVYIKVVIASKTLHKKILCRKTRVLIGRRNLSIYIYR